MADRSPTSHILMVVANDVSADGRVLKMATSAAEAGYRITVLGTTRSDRAEDLRFGSSVHVRRVPVKRVFAANGDETVRLKLARKLLSREYNAAVGRIRKEQRSGPERRLTRIRREFMLRALRRKARSDLSRRTAGSEALLNVQPQGRLSSWRGESGWLHDLEHSLGGEIERLSPDLIHAHDIHVIGVVERAAARLSAKGADVPIIYDAHEFVAGIARADAAAVSRLASLEEEYIRRYQAVLTVSDPLADLLVDRHGLAERPQVVLNAPRSGVPSPVDVRSVVGLPEETKLLVYSGGLAPVRDVDVLVAALQHLPGWHLAVVAKADDQFWEGLSEQALNLGVSDRLHHAPFVPPSQVTSYLSSATLGVHPLRSGYTNHEVALPNKLFEYLLAGLPVVVSDCQTMREFVRTNDVGEVFASGDDRSLADAVQRASARLTELRFRATTSELRQAISWQSQEKTLISLYERYLPARSAGSKVSLTVPPSSMPEPAPHVVVGSHNTFGRAAALCRVIRANGFTARFTAIGGRRSDDFRIAVTRQDWESSEWQSWHLAEVVTQNTVAVLLESAEPLFGPLLGELEAELCLYRARGISVGVLLHDLPSERLHLDRTKLSNSGIPLFSTSPFDHEAIWLPEPLDVAASRPSHRSGRGSLEVVIVGQSQLTSEVESCLRSLAIDVRVHRQAVEDLSVDWHANHADLVVDGSTTTGYGPFAVRAMLHGTPAVTFGADARSRAADIPTVTVSELRDAVDDPGWLRDAHRDRCSEYVRQQHDPSRALSILKDRLIHARED